MIEEDKSILIDELLELMKKSKFSNIHKEKIREIIDNEKTSTKIEKERFKMYYGLNTDKKINITQIAKKYGCTYSAVRCSIINIRRKLITHLGKQERSTIKNIINTYKTLKQKIR